MNPSSHGDFLLPGVLRRARILRLTGWLLAIGLPLSARGQLPTPQLTSVFPPGGKVGAAVEVRLGGGDLDETVQLRFSHPGIQASAKMNPATEFEAAKPAAGVFTVRIAGDVPPGRYDVRAIGRFGVSNPRSFVVGTGDESNEPGGNNQLSSALAAPLGATINGIVDGNQIDYFQLSLKAGQRVLVDCQAQRIDSRLTGVLVLFDAQGKELLRNRSFIEQDPLLDFTAPADGDYRVALYDTTYRGGGDYFYRLTAHTAPYIDFVFPPSGLAGSNDRYTVYGRNLPGGQPAEGVAVDGVALQKMAVHIALPSGDRARRSMEVDGFVSSRSSLLDGMAYRLGASNPVWIQYSKGSVVREVEPNGLPEQSTAVDAPCEIVGQFYPAGDTDCFTFTAKNGDVFYLEMFAHQIGLESDPTMLVQKVKKNEQGQETVQEIAQVDDPGDRNNRIGGEFDTSTDDPDYRLTADEDATYRVTVRDQFGDSRNDPRFVYRLAIHRGEPDFRLIAYQAPVQAPANNNAVVLGATVLRKGGTSMIEVRLDRRYGFTEDVEISAEGLPDGVTVSSLLLGAGAPSGSLVVTAAENANAWTGSIRVLGRTRINGGETIRYARNGTAVWNSGNRQQELLAFRLSTDLVLAVMDKETLPALVQVAEDKVWETSRGGKLEIPVKVTRRGEFKQDLNLAPMDVPNELKPPNLAIKGGESEGKLQFAATNGNAKPGVYTFYLRADSVFKHQRNPEAVAAAELEQKAVDAEIAARTERNKQATEAKNQAVAVAQNMANLAKQAEQAKVAVEAEVKQAAEKVAQADSALKAAKESAAKDTNNQDLANAATAAEKARADTGAAKAAADQKLATAEKGLADAQAAAKTAAEAQSAMEKAAADADAQLKAAQQAKTVIDKRLTDAKNANNPKDLQFAVISTPIKVRVVESCLNLTAQQSASVKAGGGKIEFPVKIERRYGFEDAVEVTLEFPNGVKGLSASKLSLAKDQVEGKLEITAALDATPGEHAVTVRVTGKFNNIDNQASQVVNLNVLPGA